MVFCFLIFALYWSVVHDTALAPGTQESDSVMHIHVSILFQTLFPFRSSQSREQSRQRYTGGPYWLSVLCVIVCTCQSQTPSLSLPTTLSLETINPFSKSVSLYLFCK